MLNIICALRCEANPFIEHYRLKAMNDDGLFPVWQNDNIRIAISGIGQNNIAAAIGFVAGRYANKNEAWLNLGVGGLGHGHPGEIFWAKKIIDASDNKTYYPIPLSALSLQGVEVCTVNTPETGYTEPMLYEMEASHFFQLATRCTLGELVQVIKIVSDSKAHAVENVTAKYVDDLTRQNLAAIDQTIQALLALQKKAAEIYSEPKRFADVTGRWHFSSYQRKQLHTLLLRIEALQQEDAVDAICQQSKNAKQFLQQLNALIENSDIHFSAHD